MPFLISSCVLVPTSGFGVHHVVRLSLCRPFRTRTMHRPLLVSLFLFVIFSTFTLSTDWFVCLVSTEFESVSSVGNVSFFSQMHRVPPQGRQRRREQVQVSDLPAIIFCGRHSVRFDPRPIRWQRVWVSVGFRPIKVECSGAKGSSNVCVQQQLRQRPKGREKVDSRPLLRE